MSPAGGVEFFGMDSWMMLDFISHPVCAALGLLLGYRRGQWAGLTLLGFALGWGSLPVAWLLTIEARPEKTGGQGLTASELPEHESDWDEWRTYYFNLREDLIIQSLLLSITLLLIFWFVAAGLASEILLGTGGRAAIWAFSCLWPLLLSGLVQSSYRIPWMSEVWRFSDQIWLDSGGPVPSETNWRCTSRVPALSQTEAHGHLLAAVARSRRLYTVKGP